MRKFISSLLSGVILLMLCSACAVRAEEPRMEEQTESSLDLQTRRSPQVGAIRWDAWSGGPVTAQVEKTLGPKKYHDRLPWFSKVHDDGSVSIDGSPQEVMDQEITFAAEAGLDYWAFLIYPESDSMSVALQQYLQSKQRNRIHFCVILHGTLNAKEDRWSAERDRAIALLKEPGYQLTAQGRPLVFAFVGGEFPFERFNEFQAHARKAGLNPYCVFMGWNPSADFQNVSTQGFDAVSAYAMAGAQPTYHDLALAVKKNYWQAALKSKTPFIPLVSLGWEKSPRKDNPVSWEVGHSYHQQKVFPSVATPTEIAKHLEDGISFARNHPDICPAGTVILYAWNEYDEGGWLAPTRAATGEPDTARLKAVRSVLENRPVAVPATDETVAGNAQPSTLPEARPAPR